MSYARVHPVVGAQSPGTAASQSLVISGPLLAGDLVVVAVATVPSKTAYAVSDNAPAGGTTYALDALVANNTGTAACAVYSGVLAAPVAALTVTVAQIVGPDCNWQVMGGSYRPSAVPSVDSVASVAGFFNQLIIGPVTPASHLELVVAVAVWEPQVFPAFAVAPLAMQVQLFDPVVLNSAYADDLARTTAFTAQINTLDGRDCAMALVLYRVPPPPPPPPHAAGSCFAGGVQPSPVYRKEDYPFSRGLRRRLRRQGFHV